MTTQTEQYPARLDIDYPEKLDRLTTAFRLIWIIPIAIVAGLLSATATSTTTVVTETGDIVSQASRSAGGIVSGLFAATMLMILFRQRYPRWWFDFALQLQRFFARVGAYGALLTDAYPSTEDEQSVHLDLDYPDAKEDLNRWLPLVKWLLADPPRRGPGLPRHRRLLRRGHRMVRDPLTGRYPRGLFDYVVGVGRWALRVNAYATLLVTDRYPPFRLS